MFRCNLPITSYYLQNIHAASDDLLARKMVKHEKWALIYDACIRHNGGFTTIVTVAIRII